MSARLSPEFLIAAYREGWFPMAEDTHIGWYQPDPRAVIPLDGFHASRSLLRVVRRRRFAVRFDSDFPAVMRACAVGRPDGVWISEEFVEVYTALHRMGRAHSVEAWREGRLVGGTYGVSIGGVFMAESMFHRETDAGKVALHALVNRLRERDYAVLEVQFLTPNLRRLGAIEIPGDAYLAMLLAERDREVRFD